MARAYWFVLQYLYTLSTMWDTRIWESFARLIITVHCTVFIETKYWKQKRKCWVHYLISKYGNFKTRYEFFDLYCKIHSVFPLFRVLTVPSKDRLRGCIPRHLVMNSFLIIVMYCFLSSDWFPSLRQSHRWESKLLWGWSMLRHYRLHNPSSFTSQRGRCSSKFTCYRYLEELK